jgi:putative FmdB family regulatory protein
MRCRRCGARFEVIRPMARIDDPAPCPAGHEDTARLLPTIAVTGVRTSSEPAPAPSGGGGGCCGGGCGCG